MDGQVTHPIAALCVWECRWTKWSLNRLYRHCYSNYLVLWRAFFCFFLLLFFFFHYYHFKVWRFSRLNRTVSPGNKSGFDNKKQTNCSVLVILSLLLLSWREPLLTYEPICLHKLLVCAGKWRVKLGNEVNLVCLLWHLSGCWSCTYLFGFFFFFGPFKTSKKWKTKQKKSWYWTVNVSFDSVHVVWFPLPYFECSFQADCCFLKMCSLIKETTE